MMQIRCVDVYKILAISRQFAGTANISRCRFGVFPTPISTVKLNTSIINAVK
jgi:hypothetical protein